MRESIFSIHQIAEKRVKTKKKHFTMKMLFYLEMNPPTTEATRNQFKFQLLKISASLLGRLKRKQKTSFTH